MQKTRDMERIELKDWQRRLASDPQAQLHDIRQVIQEAVDHAGTIDGAAQRMGVAIGTLSTWIKQLDGDNRSRVIFRGFEAVEVASR